MKNNKIANALARNIIQGSLTATAWSFEFLVAAGTLTVEAFLNPSFYADLQDPPNFDFESSLSKSKKLKLKEPNIRQSLWRLQRYGFVKKEGGLYALTEKGKKIARYIFDRKKVLEKKWDRKYRVVIFDVPEKQSRFRSWLRQELYFLNYKKLQESVFVSKFPLTPDLIKEIKRQKMGNCVNYLLVDRIYKRIN